MNITDNFDDMFNCTITLHRAFEGCFNNYEFGLLMFIAANLDKTLIEIANYLEVPQSDIEALVTSESGMCFMPCARELFENYGVHNFWIIPDDTRPEVTE